MLIYLAPLVCLIGLLAYSLSSNAKTVELGRLAFFAGLLISLMKFAATYHLP